MYEFIDHVASNQVFILMFNTHTHTHARTHARTHACTNARTHARTYTPIASDNNKAICVFIQGITAGIDQITLDLIVFKWKFKKSVPVTGATVRQG